LNTLVHQIKLKMLTSPQLSLDLIILLLASLGVAFIYVTHIGEL